MNFKPKKSIKQPYPLAFRQWIKAPGSLTAHLRACSQEMSVKVLYQGKTMPWREEADILKVSFSKPVFGRIVVLLSDQKPVVLARTVMSFHAVRRVWKNVSELGERPLAHLLFNDPRIQRSSLELLYFRVGSRKNQWIQRLWRHSTGRKWGSSATWGRQSCFILNGMPMLVEEYFEPSIAKLPLFKN